MDFLFLFSLFIPEIFRLICKTTRGEKINSLMLLYAVQLKVIYRVSRWYRTARKRQPNHLDSFKNDNQDVFWKIRFKTFLVELEFLKNMKKMKIFHIGEKSWSENHFDQFPSRILVLSFFQTTVDFPIKMVSKTKVLYFWACIDPYKIPRPQGVKVIMWEDP